MAEDISSLINRFEKVLVVTDRANADIAALDEAIRVAQERKEAILGARFSADMERDALIKDIAETPYSAADLEAAARERLQILARFAPPGAPQVDIYAGAANLPAAAQPGVKIDRRTQGWSPERRAEFERKKQEREAAAQEETAIEVAGQTVTASQVAPERLPGHAAAEPPVATASAQPEPASGLPAEAVHQPVPSNTPVAPSHIAETPTIALAAPVVEETAALAPEAEVVQAAEQHIRNAAPEVIPTEAPAHQDDSTQVSDAEMLAAFDELSVQDTAVTPAREPLDDSMFDNVFDGVPDDVIMASVEQVEETRKPAPAPVHRMGM